MEYTIIGSNKCRGRAKVKNDVPRGRVVENKNGSNGKTICVHLNEKAIKFIGTDYVKLGKANNKALIIAFSEPFDEGARKLTHNGQGENATTRHCKSKDLLGEIRTGNVRVQENEWVRLYDVIDCNKRYLVFPALSKKEI